MAKCNILPNFLGRICCELFLNGMGGTHCPAPPPPHLSGHAKLYLGPVPYSHSEYLFSLVLLCDGNLRNDVSGSFYQTGSILSRLSQLAASKRKIVKDLQKCRI